MIDVDSFKDVNDRYGHDVGDKVLRELAGQLCDETAPGDLVGRYGGDEFLWALCRYDSLTIFSAVERLKLRIEGMRFSGTLPDAVITFSAGISPISMSSSRGQVLHDADIALYKAKSDGRNRVVSCDALREIASATDADLDLQNFENKTRVLQERVTAAIAAMGRRLVSTARADANSDALTLLNNRRYFDRGIARECELVRRHGRPLAIALLDIDHFHDVNASYGWVTGDIVLKFFAELAENEIRAVDWIARYGGEEFIVVMPDTVVTEAERVADRIRRRLEESKVTCADGRELSVTVSIGIARFVPEEMADPQALVQAASLALIQAKQSGRNRVAVHG